MCSSNPYPRELPKTQTTSLLAARFQRFSPRWSAFWAPHYLEPRPRRRQSGGIAPCKGSTRRRHAVRRLCMAQNPHRHQWRARCRGGGRAWLRRPWAAAGPGLASRQRAGPHASTPSAAGVEGAGGSGGHGRASRRGQAAVPVGGGGAWPGFETTRRAEGSRRGRLAGGPPPTGTPSSPAHETGHMAPGTPAGP